MTTLEKFAEEYRKNIVEWTADFFGFHASLVMEKAEADLMQAAETVNAWLTPGNELYVILHDDIPAGFLRVGYRGSNVAWIEDVYVIPEMRGRGIASEAISLAEQIISAKPGYTAVCMDAVPRNDAAIRLYRRLGYDTISLITLRKPLNELPRDRSTDFLGHDFKY